MVRNAAFVPKLIEPDVECELPAELQVPANPLDDIGNDQFVLNVVQDFQPSRGWWLLWEVDDESESGDGRLLFVSSSSPNPFLSGLSNWFYLWATAATCRSVWEATGSHARHGDDQSCLLNRPSNLSDPFL